ASVGDVRRYSQHFIDVLDMEDNEFRSLPIRDVVREDYTSLPYLASWDYGDYLSPLRPIGEEARGGMVFTFDRLLGETTFAADMRDLLALLERHYGRPVDMEFTLDLEADGAKPRPRICLLQCRPQASMAEAEGVSVPDIPEERALFISRWLVPHGRVADIRYVIYVSPSAYAALPTASQKAEVARVVGRLNQKLAGERFILIGPGRWGSSSMDLGVKVTYADIYNARMLVELGVSGTEASPEVSYGTHFFQDLVEAQIYPLAIFPDAPGALFRTEFFEDSPNALADLLPEDARWSDVVRVLDVPALTGGKRLEVVMDSEEEIAVGYLR
ncbi:MAG: PEP/pyruvate-binding domain-containing protein, partial [Anaerolineae bacterium]